MTSRCRRPDQQSLTFRTMLSQKLAWGSTITSMGWGFLFSRRSECVHTRRLRHDSDCDSVSPCSSTWSRMVDFRAGGAPSRRLSRRRTVRKRTIADLGQLPPALIDGLRVLLQGGAVVRAARGSPGMQRSLPHGHVAAVIGMLRELDLPRLLGRTASASSETWRWR